MSSPWQRANRGDFFGTIHVWGVSGEMSQAGSLDTIMTESRLFPPTAEFAKQARIPSYEAYEQLYAEAARDTEAFWGKLAKEELTGSSPSTKSWNGTSPLQNGSSAVKPTSAITA